MPVYWPYMPIKLRKAISGKRALPADLEMNTYIKWRVHAWDPELQIPATVLYHTTAWARWSFFGAMMASLSRAISEFEAWVADWSCQCCWGQVIYLKTKWFLWGSGFLHCEKHNIMAYEKPILKIFNEFDDQTINFNQSFLQWLLCTCHTWPEHLAHCIERAGGPL